MLDYRAWIIAGVILAAGLGAYVVWMTRPRVHASVRSLSAGPSTKTSKTKSLHVDGCVEDFIVQPGELVEPMVVPGATLEQVRETYGQDLDDSKKRSKEAGLQEGVYRWDENAFLLTDGWFGANDSRDFVDVSVPVGHVVESLDGIELGIDSFGTIFRKMGRDRKVEMHERLLHGDGNWTLIVSFYSACGRKFRSEYSRSFEESPEIDALVTRKPASGGNSGSEDGLLRSDTFMNKVVSEYRMVPSLGTDVAAEGMASEHD